MKFYVVKNVGKKSGKEYVALVANDCFGDLYLSFDPQTIFRVSGLSISDFQCLAVGERIEIGYLVK